MQKMKFITTVNGVPKTAKIKKWWWQFCSSRQFGDMHAKVCHRCFKFIFAVNSTCQCSVNCCDIRIYCIETECGFQECRSTLESILNYL